MRSSHFSLAIICASLAIAVGQPTNFVYSNLPGATYQLQTSYPGETGQNIVIAPFVHTAGAPAVSAANVPLPTFSNFAYLPQHQQVAYANVDAYAQQPQAQPDAVVHQPVAVAAAQPVPVAAAQPVAAAFEVETEAGPANVVKYEPIPLSADMPAEEMVYHVLMQIREQSELLLKVTDRIADNKLIGSLFSGEDKSDACSLDLAEISPLIRKLTNTAIQSQDELVVITKAAQTISPDEKDAVSAIKGSIEVMNLAKPLAAKFSDLFPAKPGCKATAMQTASKDMAKISTVVKAVSTTDLFTKNPETKANLKKIASLTKTVSKTTAKLDKQNFANLCEGSISFDSDVLSGVAEVFDSFSEVIDSFGPDATKDGEKIKKTADLIKEGAALFADLTFEEEPAVNPIPRSSPECQTDLGSLTRSLDDIADLVEIIGPELEQIQNS